MAMGKLAGVRVLEIPKFRAISSGIDTFENIIGKGDFINWLDAHKGICKTSVYGHGYDFMWHIDNKMEKTIWIWAIEDWVTEADTAPYEIIEFEGGTYVVATADADDQADTMEVIRSMSKWIENSGVYETYTRNGHDGAGHMIGGIELSGVLNEILHIDQYELFMLVKKRNTNM